MVSKTIICEICNNKVAYPENSFFFKNYQTSKDIYVCCDCKERADKIANNFHDMQIKTCDSCFRKFVYPKQGILFSNFGNQLNVCETCIKKASEKRTLLEFRCYKCGEIFTMTPEHKEFRDSLWKNEGRDIPNEYMCGDCAISLSRHNASSGSKITSTTQVVADTKPATTDEKLDYIKKFNSLINNVLKSKSQVDAVDEKELNGSKAGEKVTQCKRCGRTIEGSGTRDLCNSCEDLYANKFDAFSGNKLTSTTQVVADTKPTDTCDRSDPMKLIERILGIGRKSKNPVDSVEEKDLTEEYNSLINAFIERINETNTFLHDSYRLLAENKDMLEKHQDLCSNFENQKKEIVELFKRTFNVDVSANLDNVKGQECSSYEIKKLVNSIAGHFFAKKSDKLRCIDIGRKAVKFINESLAYHNHEIKELYSKNTNSFCERENAKISLKKFLLKSNEYERYVNIRDAFLVQNDYTSIRPYNSNKKNSNDNVLFLFNEKIIPCLHSEIEEFIKENITKLDYIRISVSGVIFFRKPFIDCLSDTANKYIIESNGEETEIAIQSYLIRVLNKSKIKEYDFVFMDPIANGKSFRELIALVSDNGYGITNRVYCERSEISHALLQLSEKIKEINKKIKGYASIYEYNKKNGDKIKTTVFVAYNFFDDYYDPNLIRPIFENADKCGITIFVINNDDYEKKRLSESISKYYTIRCDFRYKNFDGFDNIAAVVEPNNVSEWIEGYSAMLKEGVKLRNKYTEIENLPAYYSLDSTNGLHIPFAINQSNQIVNFNIAVPLCYHAFISGQTGIGKSVMLQSIISGIIRCYHPDDVELWLVDYKAVEFIEYVKNTPPHVKLVGLDTSKEFTHSLVEQIENVMNERKILFSQAGVQKIEEYKAKYGKNSISRIVLVIDEAHRLSQHISENDSDKKSFENLLSEYRALGLTVILSDQAFENSMKGITQKGRDQITVRVAMKNSIDEIKATLSVDNSYYQNDSIKNDINTLSSGDAMFRYDEEREDGSSFRHVDKIKGFLIDRNNDRFEIINQAKKRAAQQGFKQKDPWFIVAKNRSTIFDVKNPFENIMYEGDKPRRIDLVLGSPSSLDPFHHIELKRGRNSNLIMCGGNESINLSVTYFTAVTMSLKMNSKIFIFASEDRLDIEFKHYFNSTFGNKVFIAESMKDYNIALDKIKETDSSCLVIWIGIDEIIDDMQVYEPKPREFDSNINSNSGASGMSEIFALKKQLSGKLDTSVSNFSTQITFYDRSNEIFELIERASATSKFSFLVLDSMKDINRKREISIDYFGHKFAYNITNDDSSKLFGTIKTIDVDAELKASSVIYSDCGSYSVLRPYQMDEKYIDYFSKRLK